MVHCGYFDAAFNGGFEEADKDELHLDDVNADDFVKFLKVVYRGAVNGRFKSRPYDRTQRTRSAFVFCSCSSFKEDNIAAVMPLADRFQAMDILQECERVLVNDVEPSEAIPILEKCGGLDALKVRCYEKQHTNALASLSLKYLTSGGSLEQ